MKKTRLRPGFNFSLLLPGGCNAKCKFCFWEKSKKQNKHYSKNFKEYLDILGSNVTQVSITGGETTISPELLNVLDILREEKKQRELKVVLTTNGHKLKKVLKNLQGAVDHINISRHHYDDEKNNEIFGAKMLSSKKLTKLCEKVQNLGIDVTLSKVVPSDYHDKDDFKKYLKFAKKIGVMSVAIRKNHEAGSLDRTPLEEGLEQTGKESSCPVCRTTSYIVGGLRVHFKQSLSETYGGYEVFELILHPDGRLCEDWAGKKQVFVKEKGLFENRPQTVDSSTFSCGVGRRMGGSC